MPKIVNYKNVAFAYHNAKKNKYEKHKIIDFEKFEENYVDNIYEIVDMLSLSEFRSSQYSFFNINDRGKVREIANLPFYPDRIVHWSLMNVLQPIFERTFIETTYASIKNRGVDKALINLNKDLKRFPKLKYCLKIDIKKYFPNINKEILKLLFRKIIKDKEVLNHLDNLVDDYPKSGIPVGNYTSQIFGNFYLTYFDHYVKEELKAKVYHRYMDDMIILAETKEELWIMLDDMREYLHNNLDLEIKENYQIFPIDTRGVDFVGYKSYGYKITARNKNKMNAWKTCNRINKLIELYGAEYYHTRQRQGRLSAYNGILKRCTGTKLRFIIIDETKNKVKEAQNINENNNSMG